MKMHPNSLANLKPAKKGEIRNPKGRPPSVAITRERLQLLTSIARHNIELPVSAGHITGAVAEMNRMEHIYEERPIAPGLIQNFVFVLPDGTKVTPKALIDGSIVRD